jgi:Bacterial Ig-like domain (group 3)
VALFEETIPMTTTTKQTSLRGRLNTVLRDGATRRRYRRLVLELLERHDLLSIFSVITSWDDGPGSLRQAILAANAHQNDATPDEIHFEIPGTELHTINLASPLPSVTDPLVIDGYTQPGSRPNTLAVGDDAVLKIELNGSGAGSAIGLTITAGDSTVRGLVFNRFNGEGIYLAGSGAVKNRVEGNFIGTDATGTRALGNSGLYGGIRLTEFNYSAQPTASPSRNTIGGTTVVARNIISGNGGLGGVFLGPGTSDNVIQGNLIGTDATGTRALGNSVGVVILDAGIPAIEVPRNTIGGAEAGAGNVISGNSFSGIGIEGGPSNVIQGNLIGTDATGTRALGNGGSGISITTYSNLLRIGGLAAGEGNTIAFNGRSGISVDSFPNTNTSGNAILSNSIHDNAGLGIDLGSDGVTPNMPGGPHVGPNLFQNYPVLAAAESSATATTIVGTLNSTPNTTFTLQFFSSPAPDPSGFGEGQTLLGTATVTSDAKGDAPFRFTTSSPVPFGQWATATATDPAGDTSEFSAVSVVTAARVTPAVVLVGPSNLSVFGQTLPFVAIVVPSGGVTPTGSVAFGEHGVLLAVVPLEASGRATFTTSTLPPGPHVISAVYLGDASDNISLSNFVAQGVLPSLAFGGPTVTSATALTSTSVKVAFSRPLMIGPAQDPANYAIIGPDGHALTITSALYSPTDDSVTVTTRQPLKAGRSYRITVDGLRIGAVVDTYGIQLDGQHNGRPGSKFVGTIKFTGQVATSPHPTGPKLKALAQVHKKGR